jgi:hypothetical protein
MKQLVEKVVNGRCQEQLLTASRSSLLLSRHGCMCDPGAGPGSGLGSRRSEPNFSTLLTGWEEVVFAK